jgi:hypothetical protein
MSGNVFELLNSRPFQQAIIRQNPLRNEVRRAFWILDFMGGGIRRITCLWLLIFSVQFSYLKYSPDLISQRILSNYSLLERSWIEELIANTLADITIGEALQNTKYGPKNALISNHYWNQAKSIIFGEPFRMILNFHRSRGRGFEIWSR